MILGCGDAVGEMLRHDKNWAHSILRTGIPGIAPPYPKAPMLPLAQDRTGGVPCDMLVFAGRRPVWDLKFARTAAKRDLREDGPRIN